MNIATNPMEKKFVVSLFADLSNFTALCHRIENEDIIEVVNICFNILNDIVTKYDGIVHKYEGDAILCLFGYPVNYEDMAEKAVNASIEMINAVPKMIEKIEKTLGIKAELGLHIGISSGMVIIGEIGATKKTDFTLMGNSVNLASRLNSIAKDGEIVVSESIFHLTSYMFEYQPLSPLSIKGIGDNVRVYKLIKIKEKPDLKRGIKGLYSPFIGRREEMELLQKQIEDLKNNGNSKVIFITGEAGIGKTRLWNEIKKEIKNKRIAILESQCLYHGERLSYWPILQLLENIFDIRNEDKQDDIKKKIAKKLDKMSPEVQKEVMPYIAHLFAIKLEGELDEKLKYLDPKLLKTKLLVSIKLLLMLITREHPFVMTIEDYHWIDQESLEVLKFIFDSSEEIKNIMFIALSRIESNPESLRLKNLLKNIWKEKFIEIKLKPLDENSTNKLTQNLLSVMEIPQSLKKMILKKANGNPFFLEEIIRSLIESEIIIYNEGRWQAQKNVEKIYIPDTIEILVESRFDKLDDPLKEILKIAAVVGTTFHKSIIEYITNNNVDISNSLSTLEQFAFIIKLTGKQISPTDPQYKFKHPIIQEVIYNNILKQKRKKLHEKVGEGMEFLYKDRVDDFVEFIAEHYSRSDNYTKAIYWLKKAGEKSKKNYANDNAIKYYKQIISMIEEVNEETMNDLILSYESIADIQQLKGNYRNARENYEKILEIKKDLLTKARIKRKIASCYQRQSMYEDAIKILKNIKAILTENLKTIEDKKRLLESLISIYHDIAWVLYLKGNYDKALNYCKKALKELSDLNLKKDHIKYASLFNIIAAIKSRTGESESAFEYYKKAEEIYKKNNDLKGLGTIYNNISSFFAMEGNYETTIEYLKKSLEIAKRTGDALSEAIANFNIGSTYIDLGKLEAGKKYIDRYEELNQLINNQFGHGWANEGYAEFYRQKGEINKALQCINKAIEIFTKLGSKMKVIDAKFMKANILTNTENIEETGKIIKELEFYIKEHNITYLKTALELIKSKYFIKTNKFDEALEKLLKLEDKLKSLGNKENIYEVYYLIGKILKSKGQKEYKKYYSMAKEHLHKMLSKIKNEDLKSCFQNKPLNKKILTAN